LEFLLISPLKREFLSIAGADAYGEAENDRIKVIACATVIEEMQLYLALGISK